MRHSRKALRPAARRRRDPRRRRRGPRPRRGEDHRRPGRRPRRVRVKRGPGPGRRPKAEVFRVREAEDRNASREGGVGAANGNGEEARVPSRGREDGGGRHSSDVRVLARRSPPPTLRRPAGRRGLAGGLRLEAPPRCGGLEPVRPARRARDRERGGRPIRRHGRSVERRAGGFGKRRGAARRGPGVRGGCCRRRRECARRRSRPDSDARGPGRRRARRIPGGRQTQQRIVPHHAGLKKGAVGAFSIRPFVGDRVIGRSGHRAIWGRRLARIACVESSTRNATCRGVIGPSGNAARRGSVGCVIPHPHVAPAPRLREADTR